MIYNKKVFSDAGIKDVPTTWSELLDTCKKIKAVGKTPIAMGNQYSWVICHYITSLNGKLVPADVLNTNYNLENPNFSDKGYAKALDMVKELYDEGYFNKDANSTTWEMSQTMVQEGTAGMVYEEVQNLKNYNTALGEDGWGYFYLPEIENGAGEKGYITGGPDEFMINSESKHPDEAIRRIAALKDDTSEYVRKSVGNALRDISKKYPRLVEIEVDGWDLENKEIYQVYKLASKFLKKNRK